MAGLGMHMIGYIFSRGFAEFDEYGVKFFDFFWK